MPRRRVELLVSCHLGSRVTSWATRMHKVAGTAPTLISTHTAQLRVSLTHKRHLATYFPEIVGGDYTGCGWLSTLSPPPHPTCPTGYIHIAWPPTSLSSLPIILPLIPSSPSLTSHHTSLQPLINYYLLSLNNHGRSNTQRYRGAVHPRRRCRIGQQHCSGAAPDRPPFWHRKVFPNVQADLSSTTMRARQHRESSVSSLLFSPPVSPRPLFPFPAFPRLSPLPSSPSSLPSSRTYKHKSLTQQTSARRTQISPHAAPHSQPSRSSTA